MGRRSRPMRNSVLGSYFAGAESVLDKKTHQMAATMVQADFDRFDVARWLFPLEVRKKLVDAYGFANRDASNRTYKPDALGGVGVWISFSMDPEIEMLTPNAEAAVLDEVDGAPLIKVVDELRAVHYDCAVVRHVLHWMDENCTMGAMRYYWPSVAALAPGFELGECPVSFRDPYGIHDMLPLIRDAARVVAAMQMLPDKTNTREGLSVTFYQGSFERFGKTVPLPTRDFFL